MGFAVKEGSEKGSQSQKDSEKGVPLSVRPSSGGKPSQGQNSSPRLSRKFASSRGA